MLNESLAGVVLTKFVAGLIYSIVLYYAPVAMRSTSVGSQGSFGGKALGTVSQASQAQVSL